MPTSVRTMVQTLALVVFLFGCATQPTSGGEQRPAPASRFGYRLSVDESSLPAGVAVRWRSLPGGDQVQTWIRNDSETPMVVLRVDRGGAVVHRQKLVSGRAYNEVPPSGDPTAGTQEPNWQLVAGAEEVLLHLNHTPEGVVEGRSLGPDEQAEPPPPEPFSIPAIYGGQEHPIRGEIVYFAIPASTTETE